MRQCAMWVCLLGLLVGLSACEHKELCYDHTHGADVRILFDWQLLADSLRPAGMRLVCYPATGSSGWLFDFADLSGGVVHLPPTTYQVLCYNNDLEWVAVEDGAQAGQLLVFTSEAKAPDGTPACLTPDFLCGAKQNDVEVKDPELTGEQVIRLMPERLTSRYTYEVNGLQGLERMADFRAELTGMIGELSITTEGVFAARIDTLLFGGQRVGSRLKGEFVTFGYQDDCPQDFKLYLKTQTGKVHLLRQSVSDQLLSVPRVGMVGDVHLVLNFNFTLPTDSTASGGFDVSADDWEDVNIDIKIN